MRSRHPRDQGVGWSVTVVEGGGGIYRFRRVGSGVEGQSGFAPRSTRLGPSLPTSRRLTGGHSPFTHPTMEEVTGRVPPVPGRGPVPNGRTDLPPPVPTTPTPARPARPCLRTATPIPTRVAPGDSSFSLPTESVRPYWRDGADGPRSVL